MFGQGGKNNFLHNVILSMLPTFLFPQLSSNHCVDYAKSSFNTVTCVLVLRSADQSPATDPCIDFTIPPLILRPKKHKFSKKTSNV